MRIHLTNQVLQQSKGDPLCSVSRGSAENGVSSRVAACRKRLRMIRANPNGVMETKPDEFSVACNVEARSEMSRSQGAIEAGAQRLDEAGIT